MAGTLHGDEPRVGDGLRGQLGVALGLVSGALFGAARQATALLPLLGRLEPGRTMGLLETLRPSARRLNAALIVAGGLVLVLVSR